MRTNRRASSLVNFSHIHYRASPPLFSVMAQPRPWRFYPFSRRYFQSGIIVLFMLYVVLCLHDLRHQMRDVQIVYKVDDSESLSPVPEVSPRSVQRNTRATQDKILDDSPSRATMADLLKPEKHASGDMVEKSSGAEKVHQLGQNGLSLDDLHISVKTSKKFHRQRLDSVIATWFKDAKKQTYFITDEEDDEYAMKTDGHLINSNCSSSHHRKALCCKMSAELDFFLLRDRRWFCHFDDDNYVNVENLLHLLQDYDHEKDFYLGKPSIKAPLEIPYLQSGTPEHENTRSAKYVLEIHPVSAPWPKSDLRSYVALNYNRLHKIVDDFVLMRFVFPDKRSAFWFATGGAGFCISRSLMKKMEPVVSRGKFMSIGEKIRLPDDVTMGYVVETLLGVSLTVIPLFHSHLEPLSNIDMHTLRDQISFSYSTYRGNEMNTVSIPGWKTDADPTRFLSLYCFFHKKAKDCPEVSQAVV